MRTAAGSLSCFESLAVLLSRYEWLWSGLEPCLRPLIGSALNVPLGARVLLFVSLWKPEWPLTFPLFPPLFSPSLLALFWRGWRLSWQHSKF